MKRLLLALSVLLVAGAVTFTTFAQQAPPAAQSRPSPQKVEHKQTWTYNHGNKNPDVAPIPLIEGLGPEGRPNFGGCDAADASMGRNGCGSTAPLWPTPPTPPPATSPSPALCSDTNASNFGGPKPCVCKTGFKQHPTGGCIRELQPPPAPPPPPPPPPPQLCWDSGAMNYMQPAPCQYCPWGTVWNGWQCEAPYVPPPYTPPPPPSLPTCKLSGATNYGQPGHCICPNGIEYDVFDTPVRCKPNVQPPAPPKQPEPPKCKDTKATNYGGALPCKYPPPKQPEPPKCEVPGPGFGGPLPCKKPNPPPPTCPKGQFWNGTRCVGSSRPPPSPPCDCNGDYWPSTTHPAKMHTNRCGNLVNWTGRGWYCV